MITLEFTTPIVSAQWLADHLDHPDLIVLDTSIKKATSTQDHKSLDIRIKNALFFDLKASFSDKNTDIPNMLPTPEDFAESCRTLGISSHHRIVVYDTLGMYSSPRVWWMFKVMGHHHIAVLDGGLPAWKAAGLPCETNEEKTQHTLPSGNFEALYHHDLVSDADHIQKEMFSDNTVILDARSHNRFIGVDPEPRAGLKSGHIPDSVNLPYTQVLDNGTMKSVSALRKIFKDFDIENKKLIFSCGSGITACIILLAAQLAGYKNTSVYDGSWSEWGQLNGVPINK